MMGQGGGGAGAWLRSGSGYSWREGCVCFLSCCFSVYECVNAVDLVCVRCFREQRRVTHVAKGRD